MRVYFAVEQVEVLQYTQCLAQRIPNNYRSQPVMQITAPPVVHILKYFYLWPPLVYRHTEGTFRYKMMALHRLKWRRDPVILHLIITRNHPILALVFHPFLRRTNFMTCREQRFQHAVFHYFFAILNGLQLYFAKAIQ